MNTYRCTGIPRSFLYKPNSNAIMTAMFISPQPTQELIQAIKCLPDVHPLLRVTLKVDELGDIWLSEANTSVCKISLVAQDKNEIIQHFLSSPINPLKDDLCHFVISGDKETCQGITIVCHHMICDGMSILNLFRDISKFLYHENPEYNYEVEILRKELLPKPVIGFLGMRYIEKQNKIWKDREIARSADLMDSVIRTYLSQRTFRTSTLVIDAKKSSQIFEMALANNVTVNSILIGLIAVTESQVIPPTEYRNTFSIAVNLRPFITADVRNQFGFFAAGIQHTEEMGSRTLVKYIKSLDKGLKTKIHSRTAYKQQALELFHPNFLDAVELNRFHFRNDPEILKWIGMTKMDRVSASFVASNLGKVDWVNSSPLYNDVSGPFMISDLTEKYIGITTINNEIHVSISYDENVISSSIVGRFMDAISMNVELFAEELS